MPVQCDQNNGTQATKKNREPKKERIHWIVAKKWTKKQKRLKSNNAEAWTCQKNELAFESMASQKSRQQENAWSEWVRVPNGFENSQIPPHFAAHTQFRHKAKTLNLPLNNKLCVSATVRSDIILHCVCCVCVQQFNQMNNKWTYWQYYPWRF